MTLITDDLVHESSDVMRAAAYELKRVAKLLADVKEYTRAFKDGPVHIEENIPLELIAELIKEYENEGIEKRNKETGNGA